jgi:transposase InsO family protein
MSKVGYPYDNAPMERYFNMLKNECTNLFEFKIEEVLYQTVEEFTYVNYNYVLLHSYNGYIIPHEARIAASINDDIFSDKCYKNARLQQYRKTSRFHFFLML